MRIEIILTGFINDTEIAFSFRIFIRQYPIDLALFYVFTIPVLNAYCIFKIILFVSMTKTTLGQPVNYRLFSLPLYLAGHVNALLDLHFHGQ